MALAGAAGFDVGSLPVLLLAGLGSGPIDIRCAVFLIALGATQGLIGGALLGVVLRDRQRTESLMVGGVVGFGLGLWR